MVPTDRVTERGARRSWRARAGAFDRSTTCERSARWIRASPRSLPSMLGLSSIAGSWGTPRPCVVRKPEE
eukprot:6379330-Pyramimonas_sp.AAC.1